MTDAAVLLDFDGVIIDSRRAITRCLNAALAENGYAVRHRADLEPLIGPPLADGFAGLCSLDREAEPVARLVASYRHHYATASLRDTELIPAMGHVLGDLAEQWPLALATSKGSTFVRRLLNHFGIEGLFTAVCAPAMSTLHETKGQTIRRALVELGIPGAAVMVGDRSHDVIGALENDIPAIGVTWGVGGLEELKAAGATVIIDHPSALAETIRATLP